MLVEISLKISLTLLLENGLTAALDESCHILASK